MLMAVGHRQLILCHLNHGLRGRESGQDAAFVRRLAKRYELPCEIEKADVAAVALAQRVSLEVAAREVRYAFLHRMALKHTADCIYLAHHADDQAETILANLCRGTAIKGLKGMSGETATRPILLRPLLTMNRAEIDDYVKVHGLAFREDSSNVSLIYRRNRLRHEVLPLLNDVYARDVAPLIVRLGRLAGRDDECLWQQAHDFLEKEKAIAPDGSLVALKKCKALHPAVLSRVLCYWLGVSLGLSGIDSDVIESALSMLDPGGPAKINLPQGYHLRRKAGTLWVQG